MKKLNFLAALALLGASCILPACEREAIVPVRSTPVSAPPLSDTQDQIADQYIIRFREDKVPSARQRLDLQTVIDREDKIRKMAPLKAAVVAEVDAILVEHGIPESQVLHRYTTLQTGVALRTDKATMARLMADPRVSDIQQDRINRLPGKLVASPQTSTSRTQVVPCGVTALGGPKVGSSKKWIWILDTGIDMDHPDLFVHPTPFSTSFVGGTPDDACYGHGTWMAGVSAARDNSFGTVGMSPGAPVVAVKVLDCDGQAPTSRIIAGLDHVGIYDYPGDVVEINAVSLNGVVLGNCATSSAYLPSINALADNAVWIVVPAGQSNSDVNNYHPACINRSYVVTVGSTSCSQVWTSNSNFGRPTIDWVAPGENIYTTMFGGIYFYIYSPSMPAAHVAGILHFRGSQPLLNGYVTYNGASYPIPLGQVP